MGWTRRGLIFGAGAAAAWGASNYDGEIPISKEDVWTGKAIEPLGETQDHGPFKITPTDFRTQKSVTVDLGYGEAVDKKELGTPEGAVFALAKLRIENPNIEAKQAPAFVPGDYKDLTNEDDEIDAFWNDIKINGNGSTGVIRHKQLKNLDSIYLDGERVPTYPAETSNIGERIEPNGTLEGWTLATVEKGTPYELVIRSHDETTLWTLQK